MANSLADPFSDALRKGLGRAALLIDANPGREEIWAALMRACRVNLAYDAQCEDSRAPWLYGLILRTGRTRFEPDLLSALQHPGENTDLAQVFAILCLAAADDPALDREPLRKFLFDADFETIGENCFAPYVALTGAAGLAECARQFYRFMLKDDAWRIGAVKDALAETELRAARDACAELDALMLRFEQAQARPRLKPEPARSYRAFKAKLDRSGVLNGAWLAQASEADVRKLAQALLAETDATRIRRYLAAFRRRDFPLAPAKLFALVDHADARIANGAACALGRIAHPDIRARALAMILSAPPWRPLRMLRASAQPGDAARIAAALQNRSLDEDGWHGVALAVPDPLDAESPEAIALLVTLYDKNPCSLCRTSIVKALARRGALPDRIKAEIPFDADADTRSAAVDPAGAPD